MRDPVTRSEENTAVRPARDSVEAALSVLTDRWVFLVLREAFFGVRRFNDLLANLGISRKVLSRRLADLVSQGILERSPYQDRPVRHDYRLTEKGLDLFTVTVALMQWGDRWLTDTPPLRLHHRADGAAISALLECANGHRHLEARDMEWVATKPDSTGS